jgi:3-oxoacyl-[acyl-carrier-protein] synthase-3
MAGIGNTCSASVLLALGDLLDRNATEAGDNVLLAGFGAGLTWAAALFEWGEAVHPAPAGLALHHRKTIGF